MHPSLPKWEFLLKQIQLHNPVMLLYVVESIGSSPGRQGFFMIVTSKAEMQGSIGGGIMEHKFVEMARAYLQDDQQPAVQLRRQVHDKNEPSERSGMICSGEQTILMCRLDHKDLSTIQAIVSSIKNDESGTLALGPNGISFNATKPVANYHFEFRNEADWRFTEKTGYKNNLLIFGGGHCSLALSKLMSTMDFRITVYDDRANLKTMEENSFAHEKLLLNDYEELNGLVAGGPDLFAVVMTFGYRTDDKVLRALWGKPFYYLGVLGSANKMKKLLNEYQDADKEWIQKIHSPIGIGIKSQTPEEIAISIAAEIIREKNRDLP